MKWSKETIVKVVELWSVQLAAHEKFRRFLDFVSRDPLMCQRGSTWKRKSSVAAACVYVLRSFEPLRQLCKVALLGCGVKTSVIENCALDCDLWQYFRAFRQDEAQRSVELIIGSLKTVGIIPEERRCLLRDLELWLTSFGDRAAVRSPSWFQTAQVLFLKYPSVYWIQIENDDSLRRWIPHCGSFADMPSDSAADIRNIGLLLTRPSVFLSMPRFLEESWPEESNFAEGDVAMPHFAECPSGGYVDYYGDVGQLSIRRSCLSKAVAV
jgi:hypothetical protein